MKACNPVKPKIIGLVVLILHLVFVQDIYAQNYNDGPINLQVKVRDIFTNFQATDEGVFGVGFKPDELTYKIWVQDAANLDGQGWVGGNCMLANFNPPGPSQDFNATLFNYTYPGANVPQFFDLRLDAWEDESADGILGFNCPGSRCVYETNFCCANLPFGGCAFRTSDSDRCNATPFRTGLDYRRGNPCEWYDWGYLSGNCPGNKYQPKIQSYWRYTRGTGCNNAIALGSLTPGTTLSHFNSNVCYTNNYGSSPGKDVFYSFTVNTAMGVNISLCGAQGAQFDSYLYLLNSSCSAEASDNNGCGNQSRIVTSICSPGTYYVVVDGATAGAQGTFTLTINEDPSLTFTATTTPTAITCNGANDGAASVSVSGGFPPYSYLWNNGATTTSVANLAPGTYSVTVTDSDGCNVVATANIIEPTLLTATATSTDVSCGGAIDGTATVTASGGTPGPAPAPNNYSYEWSSIPVQTSRQAIFLPAGIYTATVTDDNGCTATASTTINTPVTVVATAISINDVTCFGAADGAIDIDVNGGVSPYNYNWSNGATTQDLSNLGPGSYTVTITDGINCNLVATYNILEPQLLTTSVDNTYDVSCNGDADGSIDIIASGGVQPYTYTWSNGATTSDLINVVAGAYTVTVTDANLCEANASSTINEPAVLAASFVATDPTCFAANDGAIDLTVSGGTPNYTYTWSNGANTQDLNNLPDGSYSVLIVDDNGCFAFATQNLNEPTNLDIQASLTSILCNGNATGAIDLTVSGGTGPYSFIWSNGAASEDLNGINAGAYNVTVSDQSGCSMVQSYTIAEPAILNVAAQATQDVSCNGGNNGLVDIVVSGGNPPYNYTWTNGATTEDLNSLVAGTYDVVVTDQNGCTATLSQTINEPQALGTNLVAANVDCSGGNNGSINLTVTGGTQPYAFAWSSGDITEDVSGLPEGSYSVLVTDALGCTMFDTASLTAPAGLTLQTTPTEPTCNGLPNGAIQLAVSGGVTPYTFIWSNNASTQDLNNITAGQYGVTVTDANNCASSTSVTLTEPTLMAINLDGVQDVLCNGANNGDVGITTSGGTPPYSFSWSTGSINEDLLNVTAGTYTVTATDAQGCLASLSATVNEPTAITSSTIASAPACFSSQDGSVDLTVSGGTGPYTFQWSNGATSEDLSNLPANSYAVLITDANGCVAFDTAELVTGTRIIAEYMAMNVSCNGLADGFIDITASGGITPYNFNWSNGSTNEDLLNLSGGNYTVTITDQAGCADTIDVAITEPDLLSIDLTGLDILCNGDADGLAYGIALGGTEPYSYTWSTSPVQNLPVATDLLAGTYSLSVTDANGCEVIGSVIIEEAPELILNVASLTENLCVGGEDGMATLQAQGGTGPYEYAVFTDLFQTSGTFTDLPSGDFGAIVMDANGCLASTDFTLAEPDTFSIELDPVLFTTTGATTQLEATVTPNRPIAQWIWTPDLYLDCSDCPNPMVTPLDTVTYTVEAIDSNGCVAMASIRVFARNLYEVHLPNAFSPNGDGINDEYEPMDLGATETFNIKVFDRWGSKVFESNNIDMKWDGTWKGEPLNPGVYVFVISGTYISGIEYRETGSVTLLR